MVTTFNPTIIMLKHIICIAGLALALASCEKIEKVEAPVFSVTTEKDTYAAGESVIFFFHGNPDIISCYTGELGNNYDYTDGRIAEPDFLITFDQQHIDGQQLDQFHVLVSKNFDEDYSYEGITASDVEWIDISDRFNLLGPYKDADKQVIGTNAYTNVGTANITDLLDGDRTKLYFAVRYTAEPWSNGHDTHITRVKNFVLSSRYETLNTELTTWGGFGWQMTTKFEQQAPPRNSEIQEANKVIQFRVGWGNKPGGGTYQSDGADNWAITQAVWLDRVLDMGPDRAIGIKGVNDVKKESFEYEFEYPGTYEVVFRAQNANIDGSKETICKLRIHITDPEAGE